MLKSGLRPKFNLTSV